MQEIRIGNSALRSSRMLYGCMRICGDNSPADREKGKRAVRAAIDAGINHFDHADIYGGGECEKLFGEVLKESPDLRDRILITGKCGIRLAGHPDGHAPKRYDFSQTHILRSVESTLLRLGTGQLDLLLLHRPDFLADPEEIAEVFHRLRDQGKVRHFGVSNFSPSQFSMLQAHWPEPLQANQVEINIHNISALSDGTLDQCLQLQVSPMAWCPLGGVAYPAWGNTLSERHSDRIHTELEEQARKYDAESWVVVLAWLLRHPAQILPIIGSTRPERIEAATRALELEYSREDWYRLLQARNGVEVP